MVNRFRIAGAVVVFSLLALMAIPHALMGQALITEKFSNAPLVESLNLISKKYAVKVAFDNEALSGYNINARFTNEPVEKVMSRLLKDTNFEYIVIDNVYVIRRKIAVTTDTPKVNPLKFNGVVRDRNSGESLPYASIKVVNTQLGTAANSDGFFSLAQTQTDSLAKADSLYIRVSYVGYKPIEMKVARFSHTNSPLVVELDRNDLEIKEVKVTDEYSSIVNHGFRPGELVWSSRQVAQVPTFSGIDAIAPLMLLPGVDGTTESLSGLTVRHSAADKNLVTFDGFTLYNIDHFFGSFSSLNSKVVKDIRILRGGFDAQWGGRASSVIEITGKTGNEHNLVVDAGADELSADVSVEGPIGKKLSYVVAARRSFTDYYRSPLYNSLMGVTRPDFSSVQALANTSDADVVKPTFYYYDANAKVSFKPNIRDIISVSGYTSGDKLTYNQNVQNPYVDENADLSTTGVGFRWARQWGSSFYHNLTIGGSSFNLNYVHQDSIMRYRQASQRDTVLKNYDLENVLNDFSLNLLMQFKPDVHNTFEGGLSSNLVNLNYFESYFHNVNGLSIIDTTHSSDNLSALYSGWLQNTFAGGKLKALTIGFRATYHNLSGKFYFEPRLQAIVAPTPKLSLKLAAGIYNQYVNRIVQANSSGVYRNFWIVSDGKLFPVVKSQHLIAGMTWEDKGWLVDVEGYLKYTEGISFIQNVTRRVNGNQFKTTSLLLTLDSRATGVDLLVRKDWSKGQVWAAYSLSRSFNESPKLNGGEEYYALDDHLHELKIAGTFTVGKWHLSASWIYGSPKPWDEILLTSSLQLSPDYVKNSVRLIPYHRLDAGLAFVQRVDKVEVTAGVKAFNLYDRQNVIAKPFSLSDTPVQDYLAGRALITFQEIIGMDFTPMFYLNLKF